MFIDLYSYQLNLEKRKDKYFSTVDIGQAVYLYDIKNRFRQRIFYAEFTHFIDDVIWIDESRFILLGNENDKNDKRSPIIFIGNTKTKNFEILINSNKKCVQIVKQFKAKKLKKITIVN